MNKTPVEILGARHPLSKEEIMRTSMKWEKRTKKLTTKWPAEGTLDVSVCEEMETLIKNYKPKDKKQKRRDKRERENEILKMFKEEGTGLLKSMKTAREMLKRDDKATEGKEWVTKPPPYSNGQFPMVTGRVEISGEVELTEGREGAVSPGSTGAPTHSTERRKRTTEKNPSSEEVFNCYEGLRETLAAMEMGENEKTGPLTMGKINGKKVECFKKGLEALADYHARQSLCSMGEEEEESDQHCREYEIQKSKILEECEEIREKIRAQQQERDQNWASHESMRNEPATCRKALGKEPGYYKGQLPILIKGTQGHYTPWATQDLEGLVIRLPDLNEGAGKWIRTFEEHTVGKLLAVGDIRALLARVTSMRTMGEIMQDGGIDGANGGVMNDGLLFNRYRPAIWRALREAYPTKVDPKALRGEAIGATENPATYLHGQLKRWRMETEQDPEGNELMTTMFRNSIIEAMPQPVKSRLEDVVGLTSKPYREFCDHVVHAVEKHRKDEQRQMEQGKDIQRRLTQLQLDELTNRGKKKVQAAVTTPGPEMGTMAAVSPGEPQLFGPGRAQVSTAPPVVNVYTQPPNWNGGKKHQKNVQSDKSKGTVDSRGPPGTCWGCRQTGHNRRECPTHPWQDRTGGNRNSRPPPASSAPTHEPNLNGWNPNNDWRGDPNQPSGPVNSWSGPNQPSGPVNSWSGPNQRY